MMPSSFFLSLWLAVLPAGQGLPAPPSPRHVRIFCLDVSGSMGTLDGGRTRLERATEFALAACRRSEVVDTAPVHIIYFREGAEGRQYNSLQAIESEFSRLTAGGGTSICSGLQEAARTLEQFKASENVEICLLTDGEDRDLDGIQAAQALINRLLRTRHESNLSSSVLVRSWSNDPARLSEPLVAGGVAGIVDLAKPVKIQCEPRLTLVGRPQWVGREDRLACRISCAVTIRGAPASPASVVRLESRALVQPLELGMDGAPREASIEVRPQVLADTPMRVGFTVSIPAREAMPGIGSMEFSGPKELSLEIPLPERKLANQLDVGLPGMELASISQQSVEVDFRADWKPRAGSGSAPERIVFLVGQEKVQASFEKGKASRVRLKLDQTCLQSGRIAIPIRLAPGSETIRIPIPHGEEVWSVRMAGHELELHIPEPVVNLRIESGAAEAVWVDPSRGRCRLEIPVQLVSRGDAWASSYAVLLAAQGWELLEGGRFDLLPNSGTTMGRIVLEGTLKATGPSAITITPTVCEASRNRTDAPVSVGVDLQPPPPVEVLVRPKKKEFRISPWRRRVEVEYRVQSDADWTGKGLAVLGPDGQLVPSGESMTLCLDSGPMPTTAEECREFQPAFRIQGEPPPTAVRLVVEPVRLVREPAVYLMAGGLLAVLAGMGCVFAISKGLMREKHPHS